MPRKKKQEPCEYCEGDWQSYSALEGDDADKLTIDLYPGHMISATAVLYNPRTEETEEVSVSVPMDFCPACGRDLRM